MSMLSPYDYNRVPGTVVKAFGRAGLHPIHRSRWHRPLRAAQEGDLKNLAIFESVVKCGMSRELNGSERAKRSVGHVVLEQRGPNVSQWLSVKWRDKSDHPHFLATGDNLLPRFCSVAFDTAVSLVYNSA